MKSGEAFWMRHLMLMIATLWFGSPAESAEITVNAQDAYGRIFVDVVGEIAPNDDKIFEQKVAILHAHVDKVIVTLSGPGGEALPAIKMGELIHNNGWATYVPSGTLCTSSCGIIWLAGVPRTIEGAPGVIIGFHALYNKDTHAESGAANAVLGYYLTRWGLNELGIACVTINPPNEIGWLTGPDGRECGITWEVLTPARDVPLVFAPLPMAPPAPPAKESRQDVYLDCIPTSIIDEPDPVISISVGLVVILQKSKSPEIKYFDAWHHTAKGMTYKRSEQYVDRRVGIPNMDELRWLWDGRWIKNRDVYMTGQLAMTNGVYTYKEWISHGGVSGPKTRAEEVTSSVCREAKR